MGDLLKCPWLGSCDVPRTLVSPKAAISARAVAAVFATRTAALPAFSV